MLVDPRYAYSRPPFDTPQQTPPGSTLAMMPVPDHGETTYRGTALFEDAAVLITGADSGIGRAVALAFAREGADILGSYLDEHDDAQQTARLIEAAGRRVVLAAGDIGAEEHCKHLVKECLKQFGRIDVLVNNAAFQRTHESLDDFTAEEVQRTFQTNVEGMFYLARAAAAEMTPGSSILNTASIQADNPTKSLLAYAASKAAIVNFTGNLAQMLGPKGIRVNAVAPGPVWTPLIPSTMPKDVVRTFGSKTPLGRPGQPAEIAPAYIFLASNAASFISGAILPVTGGLPLL